MFSPKNKLISIFWLLSFFVTSNSQTINYDEPSALKFNVTAGISEVTSIESKVQRIRTTKESIAKCERELLDLEKAWKNNIQKLRDQKTLIIAERDKIIKELKSGFYCSECGDSKTEIENLGRETFEQHLGRVGGQSKPASAAQIQNIIEKYRLKLEAKDQEIAKLQEGDDAVLAKQKEIEVLKNRIADLCDEITQHSQTYEKRVSNEIKDLHLSWVKNLMDFASNVLIGEDRLFINRARIKKLEQEFEIQKDKLKVSLEKENESQIERRNNLIKQKDAEIRDAQKRYQAYVPPNETRLKTLKSRLTEVEAELEKTDLSEENKTLLKGEQSDLKSKIEGLQAELNLFKTNNTNQINKLKDEITILNQEIWQLTTSLPDRIREETEKLENSYQQKINFIQQQFNSANLAIKDYRKSYSDRESFYNKSNQNYFEAVTKESNRILFAGQELSCPVSNQARTIVGTSWNQLLPCVSAYTSLARPYSMDVFNSYCVDVVSPSSLFLYKSFLLNLDDEDREIIKRNSNVNWFESIFK